MLSVRECELWKLNCAAGVRWSLRLSAVAVFRWNTLCRLSPSDPPKITTMRLAERTSTSLSLSWDVSPRPRAHSPPIRYELTYRKKVRCSCFICSFFPLTCPWQYISSLFLKHAHIIFYICYAICNVWADVIHSSQSLGQIHLQSISKRHETKDEKINSVAAVLKLTYRFS